MEKKINVYIVIGIIIIILVLICFMFFKDENMNENNINFEDSLIIDDSIVDEEDVQEEVKKIKIHITGEVNNEGIVELDKGARIDDAIKMAGNITSNADLSKVNLAYELLDGQKVYIPSLNEEIEEYVASEAGENVLEESEAVGGKININVADASALQTINGVGESLANKIINYRQKNGKFKSIDDLKNVSGIGEKKFENIKDKIVVK